MGLNEFVKPDKKKIIVLIALPIVFYLLLKLVKLKYFGIIGDLFDIIVFGLLGMLLLLLILPFDLLFDVFYESARGNALPLSIVISFYLYLSSCFLVYFYESNKKMIVDKKLVTPKQILIEIILLLLLLFVLFGLWMMKVF